MAQHPPRQREVQRREHRLDLEDGGGGHGLVGLVKILPSVGLAVLTDEPKALDADRIAACSAEDAEITTSDATYAGQAAIAKFLRWAVAYVSETRMESTGLALGWWTASPSLRVPVPDGSRAPSCPCSPGSLSLDEQQ